jgi:hypothetical protein
MEVLNFVKQFNYYIHEIAIKETWQQFMDCVLDIEDYCNKYHQPEEEEDDDDDDDGGNSDSDNNSSNEDDSFSRDDSNNAPSISIDNTSKTNQRDNNNNNNNNNNSVSSQRSNGRGSSFSFSISTNNHKIKTNRSTSSFHSSIHSSRKKTSRANLHRSSSFEFLNRSLNPNSTESKNSIYHGLSIEYNFEGLYLLHHDYLKRILYRCFLHSAAEPLQNLLTNIFNIIIKLCYSLVVSKRIDKETIEELYTQWKSKYALFLNKLEFLINKDLVQGDYNANTGKEGRWIFNELLMRLK